MRCSTVNDVILWLAAFLLALFCLIYSIATRRERYVPLPKGTLGRLRDRHTVYLGTLIALILSAAASLAERTGQGVGGGAQTLMVFHTLFCAFCVAVDSLIALYAVNLSTPSQEGRARFDCLFFLPLLAGELLILTNPLTGLCFAARDGAALVNGPGHGLLYAVSALYALVALVYVFRSGKAVPKTQRKSIAMMIVIALAGTAVQALWDAPVALFFKAVACFGFMVLTEHDGDISDSTQDDRFRCGAIVAVAVIFLMVILMNVTMILNMTHEQTESLGCIQLDVIKSDLQETISAAEADLRTIALRAEQLLAADPTRESTGSYIASEKESRLSNGSFMNLYIAGNEWHIIPGFEAPPDFHASERVWYIGATEHPGEVYISEPYKDLDTGSMCFTVSTMLSDGDTVVGMDLNFSQAQDSILRMSADRDQTAMIVTSGSLIVGYSDMSCVGERADEKLPEYAAVLRRVTASQEHGSFRVNLDGRPSIVFSSETSNHWYLILSVAMDALYADSYRQMATLGSVNLLMLTVVVIFSMMSQRSRVRFQAVLVENRRFIDGLSVKLRAIAGRVQRLGDARGLMEGEDPQALVTQVRESGQALSALTEEVRVYAEKLRLQEALNDARKGARRAGAEKVPTRRVRVGVVVTLIRCSRRATRGALTPC